MDHQTSSPRARSGGRRRRPHPAERARHRAAALSVGAFVAITGGIAMTSAATSTPTGVVTADASTATSTTTAAASSATAGDSSWSAQASTRDSTSNTVAATTQSSGS